MAKKIYSLSEKKSYKNGLMAGLRLSKSRKKTNKPSSASVKEYGFLAFNDNCDVFNVTAYGKDRTDALHNARKSLKRDPEMPCWGVTITSDKSDKDYFRKVSVRETGEIYDNWRSRYRDRDDAIRAKYKDLSKPVVKK